MIATGTVLAHYELLERLGEGAMGTVYKARDIRLRRLVALKLLLPSPLDSERVAAFLERGPGRIRPRTPESRSHRGYEK